MRSIAVLAAAITLPSVASAQLVISQQPVPGGGVSRWSQLWQDPGPNDNDLDGDSVCFADFNLTTPTDISHIEWWGEGACELGFRIQVWRQDPGTVAYQPIGVFYYRGDDNVEPETTFDTTAYTISPGPGGIFHYTLDLDTPISLAANDAANPRWFLCVIGLTHQVFQTWNWSQGVGPHHTYQFIRGHGPQFRSLGDGRAMQIGLPLCPADWNQDHTVTSQDFFDFLAAFFTGNADFNTDTITNSQDFFDYLTAFFGGC